MANNTKKTAEAVAEAATDAQNGVEAAQVEENTTATENAAETAQTDAGTVKLVYIGPNLPKAMLQCNKIYEGTTEEIKKELAPILEKFPLVDKMLVPISELAEKKEKVRTAGNIYNKYYADLSNAGLAYLEREV